MLFWVLMVQFLIHPRRTDVCFNVGCSKRCCCRRRRQYIPGTHLQYRTLDQATHTRYVPTTKGNITTKGKKKSDTCIQQCTLFVRDGHVCRSRVRNPAPLYRGQDPNPPQKNTTHVRVYSSDHACWWCCCFWYIPPKQLLLETRFARIICCWLSRKETTKKEGNRDPKYSHMVLGNTWLAPSCLLAWQNYVVALWSTRTYYCMYFAALCRADWRRCCCACGTYVLIDVGFRSLVCLCLRGVRRRKKAVQKTKTWLFCVPPRPYDY